jgi:sterol desaturase/sphingolipid hydroxylase (fatty acid hydroxylase superfamily)
MKFIKKNSLQRRRCTYVVVNLNVVGLVPVNVVISGKFWQKWQIFLAKASTMLGFFFFFLIFAFLKESF